jgi:hypothetical protein
VDAVFAALRKKRKKRKVGVGPDEGPGRGTEAHTDGKDSHLVTSNDTAWAQYSY